MNKQQLILNLEILGDEKERPIRSKLQKSSGGTIPFIWNVHTDHKSVLLCLHGFGGDKDSSVIAALMSHMDAKGIGVVTFDWPAHGESDVPDSALTVENCLDDLDTCINAIRQETDKPISCFATSFGGYLATLYRNGHPDAFEQLILRAPALKMAEVYRRLLTEEEFEKIMRDEKITQGFDRKMHLGRAFYDSLRAHDAYQNKPPFPNNVFIIQGDQDDVVDPEDTKKYAEQYGIRMELFSGTDHLFKKPGEKERIVEATDRFISKRNEEKERLNDLFTYVCAHPEERFVMHPGEAKIVADDGRLLSGEEATRYWEDKTRKSTKVWERLRIGDVVKVQDIDVPLTIEALKGDPVLLGSDYGGVCESNPDLLIMFEQNMIEYIWERG